MGGSGGGSQPSNVTQTTMTEPPEYVKAPATRFLSRAEGLSKTPYNPYTGDRIAGLTPMHERAIDMLASSPLPGMGMDEVQKTLSGGYMGANPHLDAMYNQAADQVQARLGSGALRYGGLSNSGYQQAMGQELSNLATNMYGGAYEAERSRMAGMAPMAMQMPSQYAQMLLGGGDIQRDYQQALLNENLRAFEEARMYPYQQADVLGRAVGMSMGGGGTTVAQTPGYYQPSRTAGMLGGGLLGYDLASQNGMNPWLGGGLGALAGRIL